MLALPLFWLLVLELFSFVSFPIAYRAFSRLPDRGWAFSKPLGLLFIGFGVWLIGLTHTIPNSRWTVLLALALVSALAWTAGRHIIPEMRAFLREHLSVIVATELLFIAAFLGMTLFRASITIIGQTEQPMDFMFLNSTVTSPHYPPNDPWLAGESVSYYYFGYLMIGAVAMLTGIATAIAYNLGLATVAALGAVAAFGVAFNLVRLARGSADGAVLAGITAAFLLLVASSLVGTLELLRAAGVGGEGFWGYIGISGFTQPDGPASSWRPEETHLWWWRVSRAIPAGEFNSHITEFPLFSFLIGDMHPHVMSIGFVLLAAGAAIQLYLQQGLLRLDLPGHTWAITAGLLFAAAALAATLWLDVNLLFLFPVAALVSTILLGRLWPLGVTALLTVGGLAAINLWDLPLGIALVVGALMLGAARNERSLRFGDALAVTDDLMVVGAPADSTAAPGGGVAFVYRRSGSQWSRTAQLIPTDPRRDAGFGTSVAIHEGRIAIGAPNAASAGQTYVFEIANDRWFQRTILRPPEGSPSRQFGRSVAVDSDTVASAADGSVYLFEEAGGAWGLRAKVAADAQRADFGHSISLDSGTLAVGAPGAGAASAYQRGNGSWPLSARFDTGEDGASGFGRSVSVREGLIIVGAEDVVHLFRRHVGEWRREATLSAPEDANGFGAAVACQHWYAAVGAHGVAHGPDAGTAFIYSSDGTSWSIHAKLAAPDLGSDSHFGSAIALRGDTVAVSAPGSGQGGAITFERTLDRWSQREKLIARWRFGRAVLAVGLLTAAALITFIPFHATFDSTAGGVLPLRSLLTRPLHLLLWWGLPGLLVLPMLALVMRRVFMRGSWNLMRFSFAVLIGFAPIVFRLQWFWAGPLYAVGLLLFALHQIGYRMPRADETLFAYNPRATLTLGGAVVVVGALIEGVIADERGINGEFLAVDRLLITVPMAIIISLALYAAWTFAHRDSEALRLAPVGGMDVTRADGLVPALFLLAIATALVLGTELFHVVDIFGGDLRRLNTMFKLYYQAWLLMAVLSGFALWYVGSRWNRRALAGRIGMTLWSAALIAAIGAVSYYPLTAISSRGGEGGGLDLDGLAHLGRSAPMEHAAISWIRDNVARDATVVEAAAVLCTNEPKGCHSYHADVGRIAGSTGRPTIIGWLGHERQWRSRDMHPELNARFDAVREIYETEEANGARELLAKYDADYVVVGPRERRTYGAAGAAKFAELGTPVFSAGSGSSELIIYQLTRGAL